MEKKFTKFELARMKRTAQNVDQYIQKKNKLVTKIAELQAELDGITQLIDLTDAPTKAMTGGYGTEDIIKKVVTPTDKLDKNGNVIKQTTFEFLYPDTIVPPVEEVAPTEETVGVEGVTDEADFSSVED
jgi:hypothetical protein